MLSRLQFPPTWLMEAKDAMNRSLPGRDRVLGTMMVGAKDAMNRSLLVCPTRYDTFAKACLSGVLAFAASKKVQIKMGGLLRTTKGENIDDTGTARKRNRSGLSEREL